MWRTSDILDRSGPPLCSISGSGSSSSNRSSSYDRFPGEFVSDAGRVVGQPLTLQELLYGAPTTSGLFGGTTSNLATGDNAVPVSGPSTGSTAITAPATTATPAPSGVTSNATTPPAPPPGIFGTSGPTAPGNAANPAVGHIGNTPLASYIDPASTDPRARIVPPQTPNPMADFNRQGVFNTGIGNAPTVNVAPGSVNTGVNPVRAASATAPQGGLGEGDYSALNKSIFEMNYNPAEQAINRAGAMQDRALASRLAGAGLASSGSGVGIEAQQVGERQQRLGELATNAAATASAQTIGAKQADIQANLNRQQQTNLANAGFDQQAQITNAANVLAGNTTNADNYLRTIGLNQQAAAEARASFLQYAGLQESDLARMDATQKSSYAAALNAWLQQYATLGNIGRVGATSGGSSSGGGGILSSGSSGDSAIAGAAAAAL